MITLTKRLRQESEGSKPTKSKKEESSRVSVRDKLLVKEVFLKDSTLEEYQRIQFVDTRAGGEQATWCQD